MGLWIVTGGASGIGLQIARDLKRQGRSVLVWDINPPPEPEGLEHVQLDLAQHGAIDAAAARIAGPVSCLVHCAGVYRETSIADADVSEVMLLSFRIHALAFVSAVHALLQRLEEGASIIAITSAAMDMVYPSTLGYGTSKAALQRAIVQLAVELGPRGIRVNGIAPGAIATDMTRHLWQDPGFAAERSRYIPLGRQAEPGAVSDAVQFLSSPGAAYITGEILRVDGGVRHGIFNSGVREAVARDSGAGGDSHGQ